MILIRLKGGIGNQIFQFSEFIFWKQKGFNVILDTSFYMYKNTHGGPELHKYFSCVRYSARSVTVLILILDQLHRIIFRKPLVKIKASAAQNGYLSLKTIPEIKKNYLSHLRKTKISNKVQDDVCVMHIRGGDYLLGNNTRIYSQLDESYYLKAINKMQDSSCVKLVNVVTDDKAHASKIIHLLQAKTGIDFKLSSPSNSYSDFEKIRVARKKILSNSTFSLWAALIGNDAEIIAPLTWFQEDSENKKYYERTLSSFSNKILFV